MNFKSMTLKAAALAALSVTGAALSAAPSQAAIVAGNTLDINGRPGSLVQVLGTGLNTNTADVTGLDFGANGATLGGKIRTVGATGGFLPYFAKNGTIKDLSFVGGVSGEVLKFMKINPDLFFDLKKATVTVAAINSSGFRAVDVLFEGIFKNNAGVVEGEGFLTTQLNLNTKGLDKPSSYSISSTAIPTPALIPGLLGLGVAALRKRKSEESEVEAAETAKA